MKLITDYHLKLFLIFKSNFKLKINTSFLFKLILISFFLIQVNLLFGQSSINGKVISIDAEVQAYANILLLASADSSLVKGAVTDDAGSYKIENISDGNYIIAVSVIGYKTKYTSGFDLNGTQDLKLEDIIIEEANTELQEIEVVARKALYEQKIDRMVVNVKNSVTSAGGNALEVLGRSPGVNVNEISNSIGMNGNDGVIVMIDGKASKMPAEALLGMLRGMDADNIEKIELFDTPPAQFDAEGSGGVINIILRKNKGNGTNGSYSLNVGHGRHLRYGGSLSLNYRKDKFNIYGSYSYRHSLSEHDYRFFRTVEQDNRLIQTKSKNDRMPENNNNNARLGLDFNISEKTVFGMLLSGYFNKNNNSSDNLSEFSEMDIPFSVVSSLNTSDNNWNHGLANLNIQHNFKPKESLSFDVDYLYYKNDNPSNYENDFFDGENNLLESGSVRINKVSPIANLSGKIDYNKTFKNNIQFQLGVKGTASKFNNLIEVDDLINGDYVRNEVFSQDYELDEKIGAAYTSVTFNLNKKTKVISGLRYELTDYLLGTQDDPKFIDRTFDNLFPSFFISHTLNDNNRIIFSYSKRITRPAFNELAPFVTFIDPNTFFSGNPSLRPGLSDNLKLDYKFKNVLFSLRHSITKDGIVTFQPVVDAATNTQTYTTLNLDENELTTLSVSFPFYVSKWWEIQNSASGSYEKITLFSEPENSVLEIEDFAFNMTHTFSLPKQFVLEIAGRYQSPSYYGLLKVLPKGYINIGLQKKLPNDNGTLRLNFSDILRTNVWRSETEVPNLNLNNTLTVGVETRIVRLSYSRTFGNSKVKAARRRATSSAEERRRFN